MDPDHFLNSSIYKKLPLKKIIVCGGAGFIGSQFVRSSVALGIKILVYDVLTYAGHKENLAIVHDDISFIKSDINDSASFLNALYEFQPDAVVNFAAESHVDRSINKPTSFVTTNVVGTVSLLQSCQNYWESSKNDNFVFLQVSTDEVYGELGDTGQFSESTPYSPNSPYSASKAAADHFVNAWSKTFGLPTNITHCSNNYGPFQHPEKLIPNTILCALQERPIPIYGNGKNTRDWIHVEDHCKGIFLTLASENRGEVFCFGGDCEKQNIEVVQKICTYLDVNFPRQNGKSYWELATFVEDRKGHDWRYSIDFSKSNEHSITAPV